MRIDLDKHKEADESGKSERKSGPVPAGEYLCRVGHVDTSRRTRAGDPMWRVGLPIIDGPYKDHWINDNLILSQAALPRLRNVLRAMGLSGDGLELTESLIKGRIVRVYATTETYYDQMGNAKEGNKVPYGGYGPATAAEREKFGNNGRRERVPESRAWTPPDDFDDDEALPF